MKTTTKIEELRKKARRLRLPENYTPEELETAFNYSKFLQFGDMVLMAGYHYYDADENGYYGAIYQFTSPKHTCEDEIKLVDISDGFFPDDGHAIQWAMTN